MKIVSMHLVAVLLAAAIGWGTAGAEVANRVVAFVNSDVVTLYELNNRIKALIGSDPEELRKIDRERFEEVERRVLELLVEEKITLAKVKELGIDVEDREVDAAVERIRESNNWSREDLLHNIRREGTTLEKFREELRQSIQRDRLLNFEVKSRIVISEESLRKHYESHLDSFTSEGGVHLAGIVLILDDPADRGERAAVLSKAEDILERLRKGESFEDLARRFSKGPGAREGGDLGVFSWSELDEQIIKAIEHLDPGQVSAPILRPAGVQILKVIERRDGRVELFEEVRDDIYEILYDLEMDARYTKWIEDLKQKAYIKRVL